MSTPFFRPIITNQTVLNLHQLGTHVYQPILKSSPAYKPPDLIKSIVFRMDPEDLLAELCFLFSKAMYTNVLMETKKHIVAHSGEWVSYSKDPEAVCEVVHQYPKLIECKKAIFLWYRYTALLHHTIHYGHTINNICEIIYPLTATIYLVKSFEEWKGPTIETIEFVDDLEKQEEILLLCVRELTCPTGVWRVNRRVKRMLVEVSRKAGKDPWYRVE